MLPEQNYVNFLRHEVLARVADAFLGNGDAGREVERIRFDMVPRSSRYVRCCIYKDRAILRYRCMAAMGFLPEDESDDSTLLEQYVDLARKRDTPNKDSFILSALDVACHGCVPARYFVSNACQGCLAHPCKDACHFDAVRIVNGKSMIDTEKCRNCGMCQKRCPYEAIVKLVVPCEKACPVDAITKSYEGSAQIDYDKCISCGRCMRACPFGAMLERSEIVDAIRLIKEKQHATALVAPAICGQFNASMPQLFQALKKLGFAEVLEVAAGADLTSRHEAEEFMERMEQGQKFMTTSCCPAYVQSVRKLMPELKPFVSDTPTPMHYAAELALQKFPGTKPVFIGPCVAKRVEGMGDAAVHSVLTFEELGALFQAARINPADIAVDSTENTLGAGASNESRNYAVSGGVAGAVSHLVPADKPSPVLVSGLSRSGLKQLSGYAAGNCPGNLVEVMACEGGCVGGSGVLVDPAKSARAVETFSGIKQAKTH